MSTTAFFSTMTDGKSTVVRVSVIVGTEVPIFTASGSSRRMKGDKYDADLGELLAATRALDKVVSDLKKECRGMVRALDNQDPCG